MKTTIAITAALLSFAGISEISAQDKFHYHSAGRSQPLFSSTIVEGAQRGHADVLRAQGERALLGTKALINFEIARSMYIDNKKKAVVKRLETRRVGQTYRNEVNKKKRATRDNYLAYKRAKSLTESQNPKVQTTTTNNKKPVQPHFAILARPRNIDPKTEAQAASKLRLATSLIKKGKKTTAKKWLEEVIDKYPATQAARNAQQMLRKAS